MKINIYVATNRKIDMISNDHYKVIQLGKKVREDEDKEILNDTIGESISQKNKYYCELTALYWIWKNTFDRADDLIGLCHYRRFFFLNKAPRFLEIKIEKSIFEINKQIKTKYLVPIFKKYDIILPVPHTEICNIQEQYYTDHSKKDFDIVKDITLTLYPEYKNAFDTICSRKYFYCYNMFITKRAIFDDYMNWLFSILFAAEQKIEINENDTYQRRVFGFLAERLLNVYVYHHCLKVKEMPILYISNDEENDHYKDLKYYLKKYSFVNIKKIRRFWEKSYEAIRHIKK